MHNTGSSEVRKARYVSSKTTDNNEVHADELEPLRASESEAEVEGKLLQYTFSLAVM